MNLGSSELFLVMLVVLLLFGGKRLPELARALGKGINEFRRAAQEIQREVESPPRQTSSQQTVSHTEATQSEKDSPKITLNAHPAAQPRTSEGTSQSAS